jgi:Radical SAM superfamily
VPAMRELTKPSAASPRILLWAPALYDLAFKQHHIDGEALALYAFLREAGYACTLLDAYHRGHKSPRLTDALAGQAFDAVVVHLWTSDAYGHRLALIADELAAARAAHGIPVLGFGPLATSAAEELAAHGAIDHAAGLRTCPPSGVAILDRLCVDIGRHLSTHTPLSTLGEADLGWHPEAVVSVSASRGCRSRCTFCAYNADLGGGWQQLPISAVVADIGHLHRTSGATRFAFADTDFGGTQATCATRAADLLRGLRDAGLLGVITLSMNVRSETLTPDTVAVLARAGVRTFLIGVESFEEVTLHRLYGKRQDLAHLRTIVDAADRHGITTVASYILWHPWQTVPVLRREVAAIDEFGRWRIPQFMARSRLLVIPGTVAERQIRAAGLLTERRFHRSFRFADPAAAAIHAELAAWFDQTAVPLISHLSEDRVDDLDTLSRLKIDEWELLHTLLAPTAVAADRG